MPDLVVTVKVTLTPNDNGGASAQFSYAPSGTAAPGWSVDSSGTITPPLADPASGTFELELQDSRASIAGFNVAQTVEAMPSDLWASVAKLAEFHLTPNQPSPWPSSGPISGPLELTLNYGRPEPSPGRYCYYRLAVEIGGKIYRDDPKIYTDPVT
ncbi:MAG: hypothetical protein HC897_07380 [Thermoanaerobaculia bacterium]|nr:hypothetical protein [Thermoanaerobaculia bacterium]